MVDRWRSMGRVGGKNKKVIELFNERTGEVVRTICFRDVISFDEFVKGFNAMRYPGYGWRYREEKEKKEKQD
jgi:hypothetical protein